MRGTGFGIALEMQQSVVACVWGKVVSEVMARLTETGLRLWETGKMAQAVVSLPLHVVTCLVDLGRDWASCAQQGHAGERHSDVVLEEAICVGLYRTACSGDDAAGWQTDHCRLSSV